MQKYTHYKRCIFGRLLIATANFGGMRATLLRWAAIPTREVHFGRYSAKISNPAAVMAFPGVRVKAMKSSY